MLFVFTYKSNVFLFQVLTETSCRLPATRFAMVGPIDRPAEAWYTSDLAEINKEFNRRTGLVNRSNVSKIGATVRASQVFEEDGVHLNTESGKKFVKTILYFAGEYFDATLIDFGDETQEEVISEPSRMEIGDESGPIEGEAMTLTTNERIERIERNIRARWHNDSLVTARLREEVDYMINVKKEDKLIVTGLENKIPRPEDKREQKKWLDDMVGVALDYLVPDSSKGIAFVTAGRRLEGGIPTMCEVKMKDRDVAIAIRKEYAQKKKDKVEMGKLFVANSVTLATRVRSDILRAMALKCSNDMEDFFVVGFTSRPVLTVRRKDKSGQFALTFADAISRFGERLTRGDLRVAYGRAGESFTGQLQQNFVLLHDNGVQSSVAVAGPSMVTKKRARDEVETAGPAKRGTWNGRGAGNRRGTNRGRGNNV